MFRPNKLILRAVAVALLMMTLSVACFGAFKQGNALPDLGTFGLEGKLPAELKGRVILLDFWASWCAPCKSSFPAMEELVNKCSGQDLTIVAVCVDEKPEKMQEFLKSVKVSFTVVRDVQQMLVAAADIQAMPTSFLIDRAGKIRYIHTGFDRDKTPREYAEEIDQLLKESKP